MTKKARAAILDEGDRVLVKLLVFEGRHKISDKWESDPYLVLRKPNPDIPVYDVQREDGVGRVRTLHRNHLLPIGELPIKQVHFDPNLFQEPEQSADVSDTIDITITTQDHRPLDIVQSDNSLENNDLTLLVPDSIPSIPTIQDEIQPSTNDKPQPVVPPIPMPRRSKRNRKKPEWMLSGDYVCSQIPTTWHQKMIMNLVNRGVLSQNEGHEMMHR